MKKKRVKEICEFFEFYSGYDISTERLLEMTRAEFNLDDVSVVVDALVEGGVLSEEG